MRNVSAARVLVVDDEPELRELLADALSSEELEVVTAASGAEAIDLAGRFRPDMVITDVRLGDCNGLEVIDRLRSDQSEIPALVITGYGDAAVLAEASRRRPVDVLIKPVDVERLRSAVREELARQAKYRRLHTRTRRLRTLARNINSQRRNAQRRLDTACAELTAACRNLSGRVATQEEVINLQNELLAAGSEDDVFGSLFRAFVRRSGVVFGVAMLCDEAAELSVVGRFGVPQPDSSAFCRALIQPLVDKMLAHPRCLLMEADDSRELFPEPIRRYLPGLSTLAVPLMLSADEMIGMVVFYRKGEQPFTDEDVGFAELVAAPTAAAIRRSA